jgi:hypothetical protein
MNRSQRGLRPFSASGYEIFDEDFGETGEVVIWSRSPLAPRLGELFNIEARGDLHELVVDEIRTFSGGWTATCRTPDH